MESDTPNRPRFKRKPPRNYFSRKEQLRLLMLVGALLLVLNLASQAANPANWRWLLALENRDGDLAQNDLAQNELEEPIDNRLPRRVAPGPPVVEGEFRLAQANPQRRPSPFTMAKEAREAQAVAEREIWGDAEALEQVQDNTPFRSREHAAWTSVIEHLAAAPADQVTANRAQPVQYAQLHQQADNYRGRLVTVRGIVRRANHIPSTDPEFRPEGFWRLWLFPKTSTSPIVIYALDVPEEFPQGDSVFVELTVTGVFFKRWVYAAEGGPMTAPLVVAKSIEWEPPLDQAAGIETPQLILGVALVLALSLAVVGLIWWGNRAEPSQVEQKILDRQQKEFQQTADKLTAGPGAREKLGQLAEKLKHKEPENPSHEQEADDAGN